MLLLHLLQAIFLFATLVFCKNHENGIEISGLYIMDKVEGDMKGFFMEHLKAIHLQMIYSKEVTAGCEPFLQLEIQGKPLIQYKNLPLKFNNYGQKINGKYSWVDNENEIAIWYGYHEINQGYGGWYIGPTKNIAQPTVFIYAESYQPCPNHVQFWTYFGGNNQWIQATDDEIKVSKLNTSIYDENSAEKLEAEWKDGKMEYKEIIIAPSASKRSRKYWKIIQNTKMQQKDGQIQNNYGEWKFKIGEAFTPDSLGLEIKCKQPKSWILDCRSTSKIVQLQMVHEFNDNGYVYTERELHSGKYYKIIMKKAYDISYYHNKKAERYNKLKQMLQTSQMQITNDMQVKESHSEAKNITEKDNIKSQKIDFIEEVTKSKKELYMVGAIIFLVAIVIVLILGIGIGIYLAESPPCSASRSVSV